MEHCVVPIALASLLTPLGQGQRPAFPGGDFESTVDTSTRMFMLLSREGRQEVCVWGWWESLLPSNSHIQ